MQSTLAGDFPSRALEPNRANLAALWALVIAASPAAEILCEVLMGVVPTWLTWARVAVLALVFAAGGHSEYARPLRVFSAFNAVELAGWMAIGTVLGTDRTPEFLSEHGFVPGMLVIQCVGLVLAVLVIAVVWRLQRQPDRLYLRMGDLAAELRPTWIRIGLAGRTLRWRLVAPAVAIMTSLVAWTFIRLEGQPVAHALKMLVYAVLFAAVNALSEELILRNAVLASIEPAFGARRAILVSAALFGLGHWNGLAQGAPGVLMTSVFGFLAATAMVETRGLFWSWFMHMLPDCVLFYYWGIGAITHS
jgi:membrane protease YdiL (CAAX protease family)